VIRITHNLCEAFQVAGPVATSSGIPGGSMFRIIVMIAACALAACNGTDTDSPSPLKDWPAAPEITMAREEQGKTQIGAIRNYIEIAWTPIGGALAYRVLMARAEDSAWVLANGTPDGTRRWGIYFDKGGEGICYFRVLAVNALNEPGDTSKVYPLFYSGFQ
jgi:hypothetical protein